MSSWNIFKNSWHCIASSLAYTKRKFLRCLQCQRVENDLWKYIQISLERHKFLIVLKTLLLFLIQGKLIALKYEGQQFFRGIWSWICWEYDIHISRIHCKTIWFDSIRNQFNMVLLSSSFSTLRFRDDTLTPRWLWIIIKCQILYLKSRLKRIFEHQPIHKKIAVGQWELAKNRLLFSQIS